MYKAFLFDVDKTLTDSHKQVSPRTKAAIISATRSGLLVGVCTGRCLATIGGMLELVFSERDLHVVAGGGQILKNDGEMVFEKLIDDVIVRRIIELSEKYECRILIQKGREMYGNAKARAHRSVYFLSGQKESPVRDLSELSDKSVPLVTISQVNADFTTALGKLPVEHKVLANYDGKQYTDVTAQGVTKVFGLNKWCALQGIEKEEIVGFGDSSNDAEFLLAVGHSVAVGNATDDIKAIADEMTQDCDHDGVAKWIEKNI